MLKPLLFMLALSNAQQIYIDTGPIKERPQCGKAKSAPSYDGAAPTYGFSEFAYTQSSTRRTAISVPAPTTTTTFAPSYASLCSLLPSLSTTTWGSWNPNDTKATDTADPYGMAAWSSQWERARLPNFTFTGIYSTTVSPTPVPTSELILPPTDPFGPTDCYNFPEDFVLGVAGAAAQVEGAAAMEGKGPSWADRFIGPKFVLEMFGQEPWERDHGYSSIENYYLYKQDIERLAAMGMPYYSFSISWQRILPFTLPGTPINQEGLQHYDDLINFVLEKGMKPIVTLIHIDSPLIFYPNVSTEYIGRDSEYGFLDYRLQDPRFEDAWVNYGKIVMSHFADRVPIWVTINEPITGVDRGLSVYTVIKAHARLWHFYHDEIKGTGKVGMKFNDNFGIPLDAENPLDIEAAYQFNNAEIGVLANPIFLGKDYPEQFKLAVPDYIPLTAEDLAYMNGTADYFAIDAYTTTVVSAPPDGITNCSLTGPSHPLYPQCVVQQSTTIDGWNVGYKAKTFPYITPTYLRSYLNWGWNTYRKPVFVTEYGFSVPHEVDLPVSEQLFDSARSTYYLSFLQAMLQAIWEDNVHVLGALAWCYADNWEWGDFSSTYGLQYVNRTTQERRYRKSFFDMMDYYNTRTTRVESD